MRTCGLCQWHMAETTFQTPSQPLSASQLPARLRQLDRCRIHHTRAVATTVTTSCWSHHCHRSNHSCSLRLSISSVSSIRSATSVSPQTSEHVAHNSTTTQLHWTHEAQCIINLLFNQLMGIHRTSLHWIAIHIECLIDCLIDWLLGRSIHYSNDPFFHSFTHSVNPSINHSFEFLWLLDWLIV